MSAVGPVDETIMASENQRNNEEASGSKTTLGHYFSTRGEEHRVLEHIDRQAAEDPRPIGSRYAWAATHQRLACTYSLAGKRVKSAADSR